MPRPLPALPVLETLPALRAALARDRQAVLCAPPGSGKTTLIPLALLDEPWLSGKKILVLEPRRLAARAAARRMADLLGDDLGGTVGYQVRFEKRTSARTRIEVITEGLLTRRLQSDPELPGVGLVIFDEFHERSLDVDLALALTLDARANLNPPLRVLVMSATLDIAAVARLLGGAPVIESSGRLHPVTLRYRPARADEPVDAAVARVVGEALGETEGDVLAFLPGAREIRNAQRLLEARARGISIHPLYGDLSSADQDAALRPAPGGSRKVILATNIAQTSLTVEGVTTVVDGGYVRAARFDLGAGANRLDTLRISRASAEQRSGRAGRLGPGTAYRLWSEEQHGRLPAHDTPEILAADLTRFALELAAWGAPAPGSVPLADTPPTAAWSYAREVLHELGAVDGSGRVTPHGRALARLPAAPRLAHMLLQARDAGLAGSAAWLAALLEERSAGAIDAAAALRLARDSHRARDAVRQVLRLLDENGDATPDPDALGRCIAWAFPERIARRRAGVAGTFLCEDGGEARLPEREALAASEWIAIAHWDPEPPRRVRLAAPLSFNDVERDHRARIVTSEVVRWDVQAEAVTAEEQTRLGAIVLARKDRRGQAADAMRAAMLEGVRQLGMGALPWSAATRQWQARVMSLRAWRKDEAWPDVADAALLAGSADWLGPFLDGVTRRGHLAQLDLAGALTAMLDYPMQQKLARLAPTHYTVPTGSSLPLEYFNDGKAPALHVKLQEMFGQPTSPAVNDGRMPVVLHLLSPAQRPVAVTQDLAGFWTRGYLDVKKDMKGRYPRHPWPDDPVAAAPTRRAKPRGT
ncbi:MAG TPA: ATP-dependent helicase HrpB [Verrucomicrobiae bacterium]|nr:ATP-dependent helicase HrpB [Verrucomicrobiae bacterium]